MRTALYWIKNNPISLLSAIVAVASLVVIVVFVSKDSALKQDLEDRASTYNQVRSLRDYSISVANPDPRTFTVTVNPAVVEQAKKLNETYASQVEQLQARVPKQNADGHTVLLEGVLPKWDEASDVFEFAEIYRDKLLGMLGSTPSPDGLPRLNAGAPRPMSELETEATIFRDSYFQDQTATTGLPRSTVQPSAAEQQAREDELAEQTKIHIRQLLASEALKVKVYAQTDPLLPGFVLQMAPWAYASELPEAWELFEGQLNFWIQQDLIKAIALANADYANVLQSPVKRLVTVELEHGYTGFHTQGLVPNQPVLPLASGNAATTGNNANAIGALAERGLVFTAQPRAPLGPGARTGASNNARVPLTSPVPGFRAQVTSTLSDNFHAGPTGRISNPLYVVRHARLVVVVDSQSGIAKLTEAINSVNRMTVVGLRIQNEDEYLAIQEGFVYGETDVVRAEVIVETLWFTDWMKPLMPKRVKHYLGLEEHPEFETDSGSGFDSFEDFF